MILIISGKKNMVIQKKMIIKILLSIILGVLIGLEREKSGKVVGIRTISLITLGSTLFCLMSPNILNGDNSRIIAQIVSGIGFIGVGIIYKHDFTINGLTTATTIWASAAIGCLCGSAMYKEAIVGTIAIIIINFVFSKGKTYFKR